MSHRPACMDGREFADWQETNALLPRSNRAADPCEDCTVRFAIEMRLAGRCDGWPYDRPPGRPWALSPDEAQRRRRESWRAYKARRREAVA